MPDCLSPLSWVLIHIKVPLIYDKVVQSRNLIGNQSLTGLYRYEKHRSRQEPQPKQ